MFLGREKKRGIVLDEPTMEQMAGDTLASLSVRTVKSLRQLVASLSGGQRQTVAIAKAVLWNSKVVILDEPTAALGVAQTAQVLELVRRLADNGLGVVLISHNMNDVFAVSDRIAALYLGRMAAQVKATDVTHAQVVELITAGRSGNIGLPPEKPADFSGDVVDITPGRRQVTTTTTTTAGGVKVVKPTVASHINDYWGRVRGGDLGSIPAVLGLVVLVPDLRRRPGRVLQQAQLRQPVLAERPGRLHRDGPDLRPAARRDRPLRRFRQRRVRRDHGDPADHPRLALVRRDPRRHAHRPRDRLRPRLHGREVRHSRRSWSPWPRSSAFQGILLKLLGGGKNISITDDVRAEAGQQQPVGRAGAGSSPSLAVVGYAARAAQPGA